MSRRSAFLAATAVALVVAVWFLWPDHQIDGQPGASSTRPAAANSRTVALNSPISNPSSPIAKPDPGSTLADSLNSPAHDIRADLRIVLEVIEAFRTNFPRQGNPVGDNPEITAALTGKNQLRLALIPPHHPAINRAGELCDRWGTPFFFHAESATRMEIRSAGPDKKMWTDDDVVLSP